MQQLGVDSPAAQVRLGCRGEPIGCYGWPSGALYVCNVGKGGMRVGAGEGGMKGAVVKRCVTGCACLLHVHVMRLRDCAV